MRTFGTSRTWRGRITTTIDGTHLATLKHISEVTEIPVARIIDQALDRFFIELGIQEEAVCPPIDSGFISRRMSDSRERESQ